MSGRRGWCVSAIRCANRCEVAQAPASGLSSKMQDCIHCVNSSNEVPGNPRRRFFLPTTPCNGQIGGIRIVSYDNSPIYF
eukprot:scaffold525_cov280-Pinguiococcus_pyrenoidosus.AAC.1